MASAVIAHRWECRMLTLADQRLGNRPIIDSSIHRSFNGSSRDECFNVNWFAKRVYRLRSRLFFKTPVINPRPEISNTTDAGSGTSFIASEVAESRTEIEFSLLPWSLIEREICDATSAVPNRFGPRRGCSASTWKENTTAPFTRRSKNVPDSAYRPNASVCTCHSSVSNAETFTSMGPSAPLRRSVPVKVANAKEPA